MKFNTSKTKKTEQFPEPEMQPPSIDRFQKRVFNVADIGKIEVSYNVMHADLNITADVFFERFAKAMTGFLPYELYAELRIAIEKGVSAFEIEYKDRLEQFLEVISHPLFSPEELLAIIGPKSNEQEEHEEQISKIIEDNWSGPSNPTNQITPINPTPEPNNFDTTSPHSLETVSRPHNQVTTAIPAHSSNSTFSSNPSPPIGDKIEEYTMGEKIGKGGMGEVFLVEDRYGRSFALKQPNLNDPNVKRNWEREYRILARQNKSPTRHLQYYTAFMDESKVPVHYYILMEYLQGPTLEEWVFSRYSDPPGPKEIHYLIREILLPICQHLNFIHQLGIIHRDLTPRNILIIEEHNTFHPILIDWGVAKEIPMEKMGVPPKPFFTKHLTSRVTRVQSVGNPPEVLEGYAPIAASDIYMFGNIMYFVLSGGQYMSLVEQAQARFVMSLQDHNSHITPALDTILQKLTQYEPADRPTTLALVYELLLDIINDQHP